MNNCDVDEVSRICKDALHSNTLPKVTTNFFSKWFNRYYTFNTYGVHVYTINTANDIARYYTLKWLSEQHDIPLQQAVHTAWYICREITMYLGPLLLLDRRPMSYELLEKRLHEDYSGMITSEDIDIDINNLIKITKSIVRSTEKDTINANSNFKKRIYDEECRIKL